VTPIYTQLMTPYLCVADRLYLETVSIHLPVWVMGRLEVHLIRSSKQPSLRVVLEITDYFSSDNDQVISSNMGGFLRGFSPLPYEEIAVAPAVNRFTRRASASSMASSVPLFGNGPVWDCAKDHAGAWSRRFFSICVYVCAEAYNPDEEEDDAESRIIHPKTDDQRNRLQEACKDILLFKNLDPEQMSQVLDAMFEKMVEGGEHVIDQGDDGDNFYVIDRGTYDIYVKCDGVGRCVGTYDNRGCFGELALMYNTPRAATIIATSPGSIWGLDRVTFRRIIVKNNAKKRRMYESFIESLPFLKSLEVSERLKVVDVIGTKVYKDGEQIIAQGDLADSFFIVESGEVRIIMTRKGKQDLEENGAVEIARCSRGQYFGELALVTNKPRAASAFALGTVKCLVMDVQAFERLLGPCMEILKRNIANYEEQLSIFCEETEDVKCG
ncbi:cAMP-dependent protein kinase type II-beta regulatory subunit, partial [Lamprotornis superbus]